MLSSNKIIKFVITTIRPIIEF